MCQPHAYRGSVRQSDVTLLLALAFWGQCYRCRDSLRGGAVSALGPVLATCLACTACSATRLHRMLRPTRLLLRPRAVRQPCLSQFASRSAHVSRPVRIARQMCFHLNAGSLSSGQQSWRNTGRQAAVEGLALPLGLAVHRTWQPCGFGQSDTGNRSVVLATTHISAPQTSASTRHPPPSASPRATAKLSMRDHRTVQLWT